MRSASANQITALLSVTPEFDFMGRIDRWRGGRGEKGEKKKRSAFPIPTHNRWDENPRTLCGNCLLWKKGEQAVTPLDS